MVKAVCVLRCKLGHPHGIVWMGEVSYKGPVRFEVYIEGLPEGYHGFHVHRKGSELDGCHSLCDHYNPTGKFHGARNSQNSHLGDLGNLYSDSEDLINKEFVARRVRLSGKHSILGRSLVVHANKDDLGKGKYPDSLSTGHSGERILWGIIGLDDDLPCTREV